MVVAPEPAVKGGGALGAGGVDRAVGPAGEHGADQALRLAVGLRSARLGAQVTDAHDAAGDGVHGRDIGRAVIGHQFLHRHAVPGVERDGAAQEADRGGGFLVGRHLGVGQAGGVVAGDVHAFPAGLAAPGASRVGVGAGVVLAAAADALAGAADDAPELLDVDVDELA